MGTWRLPTSAAAAPALAAFRLAAEALGGEGGKVLGPAPVVLDTELVEVVPGENPGVVQIVELDPHRVIADRFEVEDADMGAFGDDYLGARRMPLHLGRRAFDPQIF